MRINIPDSFGSELRKFNGTCTATIEKLILGKSQQDQPKLTLRYLILDDAGLELQEGEAPAVGENVLETFSLQPQALFRVNDLYKEATNEKLPQGDWDLEEFVAMLTEKLAGTEWNLLLATEIPKGSKSGDAITVVKKRTIAG